MPVLLKFRDWTKENPLLTKTVIVVAGSVSLLAAAAGTLGLILPKVIIAAKALFAVFMANPVLLAVAAAVAIVGRQFMKLAEEVGGFERAWDLTMLAMQSNFWTFVQNVLNGINRVTQHLPGIGQVMGEVLDDVNEKVREADSLFDALATSAIKPAAKEVGSMSDMIAEMGANSENAFSTMSESAEKATEEVRKTKEEIAQINKEMNDLEKQLLGDIADERTNIAKAYVDQEEKVNGIRLSLASETDAQRIVDLQTQLATESAALQSAQQYEINLMQEISEQRRRMRLTDFEREVEDIQARLIHKVSEFTQKMRFLRMELEEKEKQTKAINKLELTTTAVVQEEVEKREKKVVESINIQIKKYDELARAAQRSSSFGSSAFLTSSVSSTPRFAHGGTVPGPVGQPVPIMAHGQEEIIPARDAGRGGSGGGVSITINNPSIRSDGDLREMEKMIEKVFRQVVANNQIAF